MKKSSKVMLLTAAVVGVVGIGMSIGGVAMGATIAGLNLSKYGFDGIVKQTANISALMTKMTGNRTGMRSHSLNRLKQIMTKKFLKQHQFLI